MNKMISIIAVSSMLCLCAGCERNSRTVTLQQLSANGEVVETWENATVIRSMSGWVRFRTSDGKEIMIDGPHRWIEN